MKLYIVRHGQTNENAAGIVQGWLDTELNETGVAQAKAAAREFKGDIDAIYSSDLKRAVNTAREFRNHYPNTPYLEDPRLRERNFGDASGTHRDQHNWEQFWSIVDRPTIPNAESVNEFTNRVREFLDELRAQPYNAVLIVAHGGVINRIQTIMDPNHVQYPHENASVLEIELA